ncbi:hypothetical protein [Mangrovibacterium sp.]|uniref:hypothetical protein n=1 Tax=Mangrovibacterium sp. TaxID=1961364 RepID=UPI0035637E99
MVYSLKTLDLSNRKTDAPLFGQIEEILLTVGQDIKEAFTDEDQNVTLYHFSKAKSSCMVLAELLQAGRVDELDEFANKLIKHNQELILMLNNYIHLTRINIIIDLRRKIK